VPESATPDRRRRWLKSASGFSSSSRSFCGWALLNHTVRPLSCVHLDDSPSHHTLSSPPLPPSPPVSPPWGPRAGGLDLRQGPFPALRRSTSLRRNWTMPRSHWWGAHSWWQPRLRSRMLPLVITRSPWTRCRSVATTQKLSCSSSKTIKRLTACCTPPCQMGRT
jgi:hypothetical protein